MRISRSFVFTIAFSLTIIAMLTLSCSDDDKTNNSVTPTSQWAWEPLGSGTNDYVRGLTVYDNKLIAGGDFDSAGGVSANNIAA